MLTWQLQVVTTTSSSYKYFKLTLQVTSEDSDNISYTKDSLEPLVSTPTAGNNHYNYRYKFWFLTQIW